MSLMCSALLLIMSAPARAASEEAVRPRAEQPLATLPTGDAGEVRAALLAWEAPILPASARLEPPITLDRVGSRFGLRSDPFRSTPRLHSGLDLPGVAGTPVRAAADGVVARAQRAGSYGKLVTIDHGEGLETRYAHLSAIVVSSGTSVRRGDVVGLIGSTGRSTGAHLHFEVRIDGRADDPLERIGATIPGAVSARPVSSRWAGWGAATLDRLPSSRIN